MYLLPFPSVPFTTYLQQAETQARKILSRSVASAFPLCAPQALVSPFPVLVYYLGISVVYESVLDVFLVLLVVQFVEVARYPSFLNACQLCHIERYRSMRKLSKEMVEERVEKVIVHEDKSMEIIFRYDDEMKKLLMAMEQRKGEMA